MDKEINPYWDIGRDIAGKSHLFYWKNKMTKADFWRRS